MNNFIPHNLIPNTFIPLSVPQIKGNEWQYVKQCLDSGWVSSAGKFVNLFEDKLASYLGVKKAVCMVNGTAALHIALKVCGIEPGDEVIVPTLTFIAPVNAVRYVGAEPIFMDCDKYYNLDIEKCTEFIREKCQVKDGFCYNPQTKKKIRAIILVHVFGIPADIDPLLEICRHYNIKVIEDACEAIGSEYKGKKAGSIGDVGCFSFNGNKIITTGAGGVLVTNNELLAEKARYLTEQAKDDPEYYIHHEIGYNYRMSNVQAAIGVAQLEQLDQFISIKRNNHAQFKEALERQGFHIVSEPAYARSNYWFYSLQLNSLAERDLILKKLKDNNIQSRTAWSLSHLQKPYLNCQAYNISRAPDLWEMTLSIPCSTNLTLEDISRICAVIAEGREEERVRELERIREEEKIRELEVIKQDEHSQKELCYDAEKNNNLREAVKEYWEKPDTISLRDENLRVLEKNALASLLKPEWTVVDFGCGDGVNTLEYAVKVKKIYGIDASRSMINKARQRLSPSSPGNIEFLQMKIDETIDFIKKNNISVDCIITQRMLINLESYREQRSYFLKLSQVLVLGGFFISLECITEGIDNLNQLRKKAELPPLEKPWHNRFLTENEFRSLFHEHGFKIIEEKDFSLYAFLTRVLGNALFNHFGSPESKEMDRLASSLQANTALLNGQKIGYQRLIAGEKTFGSEKTPDNEKAFGHEQTLGQEKLKTAAAEKNSREVGNMIAPQNMMIQPKPKITIGNHAIGGGSKAFIIAEAGVNHNGNLNLAKRLVDAAVEAKADAIKFQTFKTEDVVLETVEQAEYQKKNAQDQSQFSMLKKLELPYGDFRKLKEYCDSRGILFLSTPHTGEAAEFLDGLVPAFKIGSGDLTNIPHLKKIARYGKPMIIATGMATMAEAKEALQAVYSEGNNQVIMLHCTTNYPCPINEVNLRAMLAMQKELSCLVGYSDHTEGTEIAQMAAKLGAVVIEKHFTLDKSMEGPDHKASLDPQELKQLVQAINSGDYQNMELSETAQGDFEKKPNNSEITIAPLVRKSIIALTDIAEGKLFTSANIGILRPEKGLPPKYYDRVINKAAARFIRKNSFIQWEDIG